MIAFLVDGHMEQLIVQRVCPGKAVRLIGLNGRDVAIAAIAKRISTLFRLLNNRYFPVVVIIDREERDRTSEEIEADLKAEFVALGLPLDQFLGLPLDQFIVGIADRTIENWILGDPACGCRSVVGQCYEGSNGKAELKQLCKENDVTYNETTMGVDLFCGVNPNTVVRSSPSFGRLAGELRAHCQWLRQRLVA